MQHAENNSSRAFAAVVPFMRAGVFQWEYLSHQDSSTAVSVQVPVEEDLPIGSEVTCVVPNLTPGRSAKWVEWSKMGRFGCSGGGMA